MITTTPTITHSHAKTWQTYDGGKRQSRSRLGKHNAQCACGFIASDKDKDEAETRLVVHIEKASDPNHDFTDHAYSRGRCTLCGLDRAAHDATSFPILAELAGEYIDIEHLTALGANVVAEDEPGERLTIWKQNVTNREDWTSIAIPRDGEEALLAVLLARKAARESK